MQLFHGLRLLTFLENTIEREACHEELERQLQSSGGFRALASRCKMDGQDEGVTTLLHPTDRAHEQGPDPSANIIAGCT